jgi:hypothetical protein
MDERFDVSADMRLLELQRRALGLAEPAAATWRSRSGNESGEGEADASAREPAGISIAAQLDASPRSGIIPGALVTVTLALVNNGATAARDVRVSMPLPLDAAIHPGTLRIDGTARGDDQAAELFGDGLAIGDLAAGSRRTILVRLVIGPGTSDLTMSAHVEAGAGAIAGPGAIRLSRGAAPTRPAAEERPFYEPDESEASIESGLPEPAFIAVVQPAEVPPAPVPPESIAPPVTELPAPTPPIALPSAPAIRGSGGPVLLTTLDRRRYAALTALFRERSLGMIAHYLVLNALATVEPLPGDGEAPELRTFVTNQERLLTRALVSQRLGKPSPPESIAALFPAFPPPLAPRTGEVPLPEPEPGTLVLVRAFSEREIGFLGGMLANAGSPPFLRAAQLFVGLCATDSAETDDATRRTMATLLSRYAGLAAAEISRIFLRAKLTRTPAVFKESGADLDDAARAVLAAIGAALG